jgi:hypothetical protein
MNIFTSKSASFQSLKTLATFLHRQVTTDKIRDKTH